MKINSALQLFARRPTVDISSINLSLRRLLSLSSARSSSIELSVVPQDALLDNPPQISAKGLIDKQKVTLWNTFTDDSGLEFTSHAHYIANSRGEINVRNQMSVGGNYNGIFPEGLVATMNTTMSSYERKKCLKWARLLKNDVTSPMKYSIKLLEGHVDEEAIYSNASSLLAENIFTRHLMLEGVQRQEISEGLLRGTLFTPPGEGPFPTVLDLYGLDSGPMESRSAMLASYGYASLALSYSDYKDLPKITSEINLDYFLEAIEFLSSHPKANKGHVGVIGSAKGGEIGIMLSTLTDKIKALIAINSCSVSINVRYKLNDKTCLEMFEADSDKCQTVVDKNGLLVTAFPDTIFLWDTKNIVPIEKSHDDCRILMVSGDDDGSLAYKSCMALRDRAERYNKKNVYQLVYPGVGHVIDPPFFAHLNAGLNSTTNISRETKDGSNEIPYKYGGFPYEVTHASKDLWAKTLSLFHKRLVHDAGLDIEKFESYPSLKQDAA